MNIFVSDPDPVISAQVLPDKHIVKMPLETCQMLAIVASDKWGHGYGSLPKIDGKPSMQQTREHSVIILAPYGQMKQFQTQGG